MKIEGYNGEYLSEDDILYIHDKIIENSESNDSKGFIDGDGALFKGAVNSIFASFFGQDVYPSIEEKACRLCYNIITAHCFNNANKRTGLFTMIETYKINGMELKLSEKELYDAVTTIGSHANEEVWEQFKDQIIQNLKEMKL